MLLDFGSWWEGMEWFERVYWIFAVPSSLGFLIIMVTTFVGGDMDSDFDDGADADVEGDSGPGFQFFTFKNLVGFFTIFAWSGLACINAELSTPITVIVSMVCGTLMMVVMASIFYFLSKLVDSGTLNVKNAIGKLGEVYLTIPGAKAGFGKVQLTVQGSVRELQAMTNEEEDIMTGTMIKVLDVVDEHILLVERTNK